MCYLVGLRTVDLRRWILGLALSVLVPAAAAGAAETLAYDQGVVGLRQKLAELQTAASLLQTTAHPDDEHGGMLARLARGEGVRVSLLSLTRGEAGANAIGPELFDALGWIRAEELTLAGRYYGLDALYFTRLADYGYSKRLDEALETWGREDALGDMVRVLRMERPLVVVSRFRGDARDGHGQHQFAGALTPEAVRAAADPDRFPEQLAAGLRPWRTLKLYAGGAREDEAWAVAVDSGVHSSWLGDSFENVARAGLSLQRSQNAGQTRPVEGSFVRYYDRLASEVEATPRESGFFDGIDVSLLGVAERLGAPGSMRPALEEIEAHARRALAELDPDAPEAIVPELARGLEATRELRAASRDLPDVDLLLARKEAQFSEAIALALGIELRATAALSGAFESSSSPFAPEPTMGPAVPGQELDVRLAVSSGAPTALLVKAVRLVVEGGSVTGDLSGAPLAAGEAMVRLVRVKLSPDAPTWTPHVARASIAVSRYRGEGSWWRAAPPPAAVAEVDLEVDGVVVTRRESVRRLQSQAPYGSAARELEVLPAVSLRVSPKLLVVPEGSEEERELTVSVRDFRATGPEEATLALELPPGVRATPDERAVTLGGEGETVNASFRVRLPPGGPSSGACIGAVLRVGGRDYRTAYLPIEHRDLETRYDVEPAETRVVSADVSVPDGLRVGYVMGVGDEVPQAIAELGASVELLDAEALESGSLGGLDAIVVGTRAYAVRDDLRIDNPRLLDYVEGGGNLVVLYNTFELDPNRFAPFPGELPPSAEEISEEDAPVEILRPDDPVMTWPNRITTQDFDGWVEQRGSKFWSGWDDAYVPLVVSADTGQSPQRGGWLACRYGKGHYTYFAYALHRQLPFGVPGAYRILANLLSLRRSPEGGE